MRRLPALLTALAMAVAVLLALALAATSARIPLARALRSLLVGALVLLTGIALAAGVTVPARAASAPPLSTPTATPTYHPTLQLSATGGTRDQALVVVASGFPDHAPLTVSWDGAALTRGTTDDAGYLALRTAVPHAATDGPHEVRAAGPAHTAAGAAFTVAAPAVTYRPALAASPAQALPGARLVALASGFPPHGALTLSWDGATVAQATADDSGAARLDTTLPTTGAGSTAGPHELRIVGPAQTTASSPVTVLDPAQVYHPALALDAAQGTRGAKVALAATGFAPNQDVHVYWDRGGGTDLGMVRADTSGNADHTVTIGQGFSVTDGAHRLYAVGARPTLAASAFYTVQPTPPACGGLVIPLPFVAPLCLDPVGWLTSTLSGGATAAADAIGRQVAPALIDQPDYSANLELMAPFTVLQGLGRDLFGILFVAGVLSWSVRRLGLGSPGDAGAQIMEGAVGLGLMQALPSLIPSYIKAVNGLSGAILDDPGNKAGGAIIASLVRDLVTTGLFSGLAGLPLVLVVITGAILVFLVLLLLIIITRDIGITYGAAVFVAAPLCIVCGVTPLTRGVAFAWARLWFSLTLWGVWYALALVVVRAELATFATGGGLPALAGALAGILVVYGAPKLGDALIGGGATRALGIGHVPLLSTAIGTATGMAVGGGLGAVGAAMKGGAMAGGGGEAAAPAAPAMPTVTELGGSAGPALSGGDTLEGAWGLLESAGV